MGSHGRPLCRRRWWGPWNRPFDSAKRARLDAGRSIAEGATKETPSPERLFTGTQEPLRREGHRHLWLALYLEAIAFLAVSTESRKWGCSKESPWGKFFHWCRLFGSPSLFLALFWSS